MEPLSFVALALACAPLVHSHTTQALVAVESGFNPFAIGVVNGSLLRQPRSLAEAQATARQLQREGWNFSVGLAQINQANFRRLGLSLESSFEPCTNLQAMQAVLGECFQRARQQGAAPEPLRAALSCYYSGNFHTGLQHGYVQRVAVASSRLQRVALQPPSPGAPRSGPALPASNPMKERT